MKSITCVMSATRTLQHAFLSARQIPKPLSLESKILRKGPQLRLLYYSRPRSVTDGNNNLSEVQRKSGIVKDEEIKAEIIQVVNDSGGLDPPISKADVLSSLQRDKYYLVQMSPGSVHQAPVCKIVTKELLREQRRLKSKATHLNKTTTKQIELNWAIDPHDLSHRLKSLASFIEKGRRVELILARKRGKRAPTADEVTRVMDSVLDAIEKANAMQVKPMEGQPGKHLLIIVKKKEP